MLTCTAMSMVHSFLTIAGPGVYTLVVNNGDGTADQFSCPNSPLGYYLKYSELIGSSIKNLVLCILANTKGACAYA